MHTAHSFFRFRVLFFASYCLVVPFYLFYSFILRHSPTFFPAQSPSRSLTILALSPAIELPLVQPRSHHKPVSSLWRAWPKTGRENCTTLHQLHRSHPPPVAQDHSHHAPQPGSSFSTVRYKVAALRSLSSVADDTAHSCSCTVSALCTHCIRTCSTRLQRRLVACARLPELVTSLPAARTETHASPPCHSTTAPSLDTFPPPFPSIFAHTRKAVPSAGEVAACTKHREPHAHLPWIPFSLVHPLDSCVSPPTPRRETPPAAVKLFTASPSASLFESTRAQNAASVPRHDLHWSSTLHPRLVFVFNRGSRHHSRASPSPRLLLSRCDGPSSIVAAPTTTPTPSLLAAVDILVS